MREHEVPTHVQAEDRVLLWFTFPQLVAMTMVAALAYGAYRYAPLGSTELRIGLAVVLGLVGMAMIVGKIGGRRLPLVAADLLKYRLGNRRYAGTPAQLVRPQPPAPVQSKPGSVTLLVRRARRIARRGNCRLPFRLPGWFGRGRKRPGENGSKDPARDNGRRSTGSEGRRRRDGDRGKDPARRGRKSRKNRGRRRGGRNPKRTGDWRSWAAVLAVVAVAAAGTIPPAALADDHHPEGLGFEIAEPVPGRRVFIEGLTVEGDRAFVTVRAAAALDLRVRAYGGDDGGVLVHREISGLGKGERKTYALPLSGDAPSLTFSWRDGLGQTGAVSVKGGQIPYPLPLVEGELCDLEVSSLGWSPGWVRGTVESECEDTTSEVVSLPIVSGHESVTVDAATDAAVTAIAGTVTATAGGAVSVEELVPDGFTRFRVPIFQGKALYRVSIEVQAEATLRVEQPPMVGLTHHPEREEKVTQQVDLYRPGTSRTVSETVHVSHPDGTTTQRVISANLSIPGATVRRDATVTVTHEEHVRAEVTERGPMTLGRVEPLEMTSSIGVDDPFVALKLPEPEPQPEPATQTPGDAGELKRLFELLGWEWPW